jgi:hypothetical protein
MTAGFFVWCALGAAVGLCLFALGWRGRRVGAHPVCRRCDFDLSGRHATGGEGGPGDASAPVCPECGADLGPAHAVATGARRRSPIAMGLGAPLAVAGVLLIVVALGGSSAHRYKPLGWLLAEARLATPARAGELGAELLRRNASGALDADDLERTVAALLDLQADRRAAWDKSYGDLIEQAPLSPSQAERYDRQMFLLGARVRERIARGFPIPVLIEAVEIRTGTSTQRSDMFIEVRGATVNGRPARFVRPGRSGADTPDSTFAVAQLRVMGSLPSPTRPGGVVLIEPPEGVGPGPISVSLESIVRPPGAMRAGPVAPDSPWWRTHDGLVATLTDEASTVTIDRGDIVAARPPSRPVALVEFASQRGIVPPYLRVNRLDTSERLAHRMVVVYADGREIPVAWYTTVGAPTKLVAPEAIDDPPPFREGEAQFVFDFGDSNLGGSSAILDRSIDLEEGMSMILRPDPWLAEHTVEIDTLPHGNIHMGEIEIDRRP